MPVGSDAVRRDVCFVKEPRDGASGRHERIRLRPAHRRKPSDKQRVMLVPARCKLKLINRINHYNFDGYYAIGLGRWAFQVATEWKTPSAAQHLHKHWINEAAGWRRPLIIQSLIQRLGVTGSVKLRIMCFWRCCCCTFSANPEPRIPWNARLRHHVRHRKR